MGARSPPSPINECGISNREGEKEETSRLGREADKIIKKERNKGGSQVDPACHIQGATETDLIYTPGHDGH